MLYISFIRKKIHTFRKKENYKIIDSINQYMFRFESIRIIILNNYPTTILVNNPKQY
jgi:hypothetical protein